MITDDWEPALRREFPEWMDGKVAILFWIPTDKETGAPILPPFVGQQVYGTRTMPNGTARTGFFQWYTRPQLAEAIRICQVAADARAYTLPKQEVMPGMFNRI